MVDTVTILGPKKKKKKENGFRNQYLLRQYKKIRSLGTISKVTKERRYCQTVMGFSKSTENFSHSVYPNNFQSTAGASLSLVPTRCQNGGTPDDTEFSLGA